MSQTPQYLVHNIGWLTQQWTSKVNVWKEEADELNQIGQPIKYSSKIDPVSLSKIKREGSISLGEHSYNPSTVIGLLNALSQTHGVSPTVGDTGVSLSDFIRSTICPDPTIIQLYIYDGIQVRPLNQVELNWYFSGEYEPTNQRPIQGLEDPQRGQISVPELIHLYNVFFKTSQTRSGQAFSKGGKTIKRKKTQLVNKKSISSTRTRRTRRRTTRRRRWIVIIILNFC